MRLAYQSAMAAHGDGNERRECSGHGEVSELITVVCPFGRLPEVHDRGYYWYPGPLG